ncbi:DUF3109 family protein [Thermodesulfobacteriota bacterium]
MKEIIVIDDIEIDMDEIYSVTHECNQDFCKGSICCCSCYEICIDNNEITTITDWIPEAAKFSACLNTDLDFDNIFDQIKRDLYSIDREDKGLCVFAYINPDQKTFCSLHSAALKYDIPPHEVKPRSCTLWPLALTEDLPLRLSIDDDAFSFPCNSRRATDKNTLCNSIGDIICQVFGEDFLLKLKDIKSSN